jgi:hypothetical protein
MKEISKYLSVTERDYNALAGSEWPSYDLFIQHYDVPDFVYQEIDEAQSKVEQFDNPAFCVLPFYGMEYPSNKECCLIDYSQESIQSVKQKMLSGVRPKACEKCWTLEDKGIVSDRIIKNNNIDLILDKDLKVIENECGIGNHGLLHYKIDTNNTCNAACITCNGGSSSAWIGLEKKQGLLIHKAWHLALNEINIDYENAKLINFRGGEPLLSSLNFEILRKLIENKNTDCFVSFTTNGSIKLNQTQIEILSHFKKLNFCLSIDGIGKKFEYLRYPLKWNNLLENIDQYKQLKIDLSASFTLSNVNMMYYSETVEWFRTNKIAYLNNIVYNPNYFSPTSLPKKIKEKIIDKNNLIFISTHNNNDDLLFRQFLVKIQEQDNLKNIRMQDYVPEFYDLIEEYL